MKNHPLLKHTRAYFSSPDPATPRNLTKEMLETYRGFSQTAPGYLALDQQYQPLRGQLALTNQEQNLHGFVDADGVYHPGQLNMQRESTQFQRAGDIADVAALGPASTQAFLAANPYLAASLNNLGGRMEDSDILKTLNADALAGLRGGGKLSSQESRALDQSTRAAFADRGTGYGNQAIGAELLNRDAAVRQRQQQAQQLASGVQGLNQNQNDFVGRAAQIYGTTLSDPFQAILGRSSGAGSSGGGYPQQIGTGATLFDPTNAYASDLYNSNFNAENAHNIADANAQNAATSSYISAAASVLGALISDKRVKKNIKKTGEKTKDGDDIYEWSYATDPKKKVYRGPMAQDVEKRDPKLVLTDPISGLKSIKGEAVTDFSQKVGSGKKAKYLNLISGELEEAA